MKKRWYKYDPETRQFYSKDGKNEDAGLQLLGGIRTRKGALTRKHKLAIIHANGEWVLL